MAVVQIWALGGSFVAYRVVFWHQKARLVLVLRVIGFFRMIILKPRVVILRARMIRMVRRMTRP